MSSLSKAIPRYRPTGQSRLPPAKPPLFRSVVAHPPAPFASASDARDSPQQASTSKPTGPHRIIYTTAPRPLIPLTTSPANHLLWNPPAADAKGSRVVERDESGRLARFASRFAGVGGIDGEGEEGENKSQFMPEADLSFLEGETLQSPVKALGKKDIVGIPKAKKGKK